MLSESEIEKRIPVWDALSELFLDTELTESTYEFIAKVIIESGFSPKEVDHILWREVFPAVGDNLRCVAGEWAGFDQQWLKDRIIEVLSGETVPFSSSGIISVKTLLEITIKEWSDVCKYLPGEHAILLSEAQNVMPLNTRNNTKKWWPF